MQLVFKVFTYSILIFLSIQNTFSQDNPIIAQFNQDGALYKSLENFSQPLAQFKEDENCIVISYLGNYTYKIKYKEWEGFVKDEYLIINEQMMDLFFAHEKKQRNNAIQKRELRQEKIQQIVNSNLDSINKIKAQEKKRLEDLQKTKLKQQRINESRKLDSIAKVNAKEKKRLEDLQKTKLKQQRINESRKLDSIAKVNAKEKKRLEDLQKAKLKQQRINESRKLDSIAKVNAKEKKRLEDLQKTKLEQQRINESRKLDSIAKVKAKEKKRLEDLQKTKLEQQRINESRKLDSITSLKTLDQDTNPSQKIKPKNTCLYLINEYDNYYKQHVIITDKYPINEHLNIELIREGNTSKININTKEDLGCASYVPSTRSSVTVTLENNKEIKLYHSGSLDCNDFSLKAILSESKIIQLKRSPIQSLTFRGTRKSLTISDIDYKDFFIDKLKCIE